MMSLGLFMKLWLIVGANLIVLLHPRTRR